MSKDYFLRTDADLDTIYDAPSEKVTSCTLDFLHDHYIAYIKRAPIVCIGSGADEGFDVSPRGGPAGFTLIRDRHNIALPDWPGNNKIETLRNLVRNNHIALLFLFPGLDIFLRINGRAAVSRNPDTLKALSVDGKEPVTAIEVAIDKAYFHCGRAINRAKLWDSASHIDRTSLPTPGTVMKDILKLNEMTAAELDAHYNQEMIEKLY